MRGTVVFPQLLSGGDVIAGRHTVVGRDDELRLTVESVLRAPDDGLVAVFVTGERGIGKSAFLAEATAMLRWQACGVVADDLQRRVPYSALATGLRGLAGSIDNSYAERCRQEAVAALDVLNADPGLWFGRACEAVTRLLSALSAARPLLLTVDDVTELDDDSLALFAAVLRRLASAPIGVLVTVRPGAHRPVQQLVERLTGQAEIVHIDLPPLSTSALAAVVADTLGVAADGELVAEISGRADGSPFFAIEITRSLLAKGHVTTEDGTVRLIVPANRIRLINRDALLRRTAPTGHDELAVARALSVFRELRIDQISLLAQVTMLAQDTVATAFDALLATQVIVPAADGYRFSHVLLADALYEEIGPARRRYLHGAIAAALLAERAAGRPVDVLQLAWHVGESAAAGDSVAVDVLAEAAGLTRSGAPERAAELYGRAVTLLPAGDPRLATLLSARCRTLARASHADEAITVGLAALAELPVGAQRNRTATAVVASMFSAGRFAAALDLVDAEVHASPASATQHAQRAMLLVFAGRDADARAEATLTGTLPMTSPAEEVVVCGWLAMLTSMLSDHERTTAYADRAVAAGRGSPTLELQALAVGAITESLAGLVPGAVDRLRRAEIVRQDGGAGFAVELLLARIVVSWLRADWATALADLRRAAVELEDQELLSGVARAIELDIRSWRGELDLAARLTKAPAPTARNTAGLYAGALAGYLIASGDPAAALDAAAGALSDLCTYGPILLERMVDLYVSAGRHADAIAALDRLASVVGDQVSPWATALVQRAVGVAHGDQKALRESVTLAGAGGLIFEQARSQLALALLDDTAADDLLAAYRTFQRAGADAPRRAAGRRLRELGVKVPRARTRERAGQLTDSELRIARLVQQGMRNRDIAAALHYSPRSVEVYLSRIYARLRVSSRLELARLFDTIDRANRGGH